jgi:hypothetical protein
MDDFIPWDEVTSDSEFQTLSVLDKKDAFNKWRDYSRQYASDSNLWNDDFASQFQKEEEDVLRGFARETISRPKEFASRIAKGAKEGIADIEAGSRQMAGDFLSAEQNPYLTKSAEETSRYSFT